MDLVPAKSATVTSSRVPKRIGTLNVAFGGMMFVCGLTCLHPIAPALAQLQAVKLDPEWLQWLYERNREQFLQKLSDYEKKAATPVEKARLEHERVDLAAKQPKLKDQVDIRALDRDMIWVTWWFWADVVTGPMVNLLMLASGIGLLQFREWARRMAIWVAAAKLVRLAILAILLIVVVVPHVAHMMVLLLDTDLGALILNMMAEDQRSRGVQAPTVAELRSKLLGPSISGELNFWVLAFVALAAIYPIVSLIVLNRPAAKNACAQEPDDLPEDRGSEAA
jgi:hypothetical protein